VGILNRLRDWAVANTRPPFKRTSCACAKCVSFCKTAPGMLIPSDVDRIATRLVDLGRIARPDEVGRFLRATRGTDIFDNAARRGMRVPQIGPARDRRGRCVFLSSDDRCEIHTVSPFGCAYFDAHMPDQEAERRKIWSLEQVRSNRRYADLRATLDPAEGGKGER
jgi:Fe-S-cluster containining protein